jgi:arylsulfatase A-like enzyme
MAKPNILIIWGDDIGVSNLSCYSYGMMGYWTHNIDKLAWGEAAARAARARARAPRRNSWPAGPST